jgi:hypothetical protein
MRPFALMGFDPQHRLVQARRTLIADTGPRPNFLILRQDAQTFTETRESMVKVFCPSSLAVQLKAQSQPKRTLWLTA